MKMFLKKSLIYLVMTMLVLPTSVIAGYAGAEKAQAADLTIADHVVISEVKLAGLPSTKDEFVELYNPTDDKVDLTGYKLVKMTATGTESSLISDVNMSIASQSYLLFAGEDYAGAFDAKFATGASIADNNTIQLVNGSEIIDQIGFGSAMYYEGASVPNPSAGRSVERKIDNNIGNMIDTDNNSQDFYLQNTPNPQGSNTSSIFAGISAQTVLSLDKSSKTVVKAGQDIDATIGIDYPEALISQVKSTYETDAFLALANINIAAGTKLDLYYQGNKLGTYIFSATTPFVDAPYDLGEAGIKGLWLSDLIKGIDAGLPTRTPLNKEVDASWRFVLSGLPEGIYGMVVITAAGQNFPDGSSAAYYFKVLPVPMVVDGSVNAPANLVAQKTGNKIALSWNEVVDDLAGTTGYNIYSSADNFTAPIATVTKNSYDLSNLLDGKYQYEVTALDLAGNESVKSLPSNEVVIDTAQPLAATITTSTESGQSGRFIKVQWKGVGGYAERYDIYVNDILSTGNSVFIGTSTDDKDLDYTKSVKVLSDGDYKVYIKTVKGENFALSNSANAHFETAAPVSTTPTVTPVVTNSITPAKAKAAANPEPTVENQTQTPADNGVIKGDENKDEAAAATNWTPWIILFVLIIFAGAATGGYFYWFAGKEEEAKTEDKTKIETPKDEKVAVTVKSKETKSNKKPKRW